MERPLLISHGPAPDAAQSTCLPSVYAGQYLVNQLHMLVHVSGRASTPGVLLSWE